MFFQTPVVFNEKDGPRLAPPSGVDSAGRNYEGDGGGPIGAWVSWLLLPTCGFGNIFG